MPTGSRPSRRRLSIQLEPKDQVKARLGYSPDDADAFVLTFAQPMAARQRSWDRTMGRWQCGGVAAKASDYGV